MIVPFSSSLCMSLSEGLGVCCHEKLKGVVSAIIGCMIHNMGLFYVYYCWCFLVYLGERIYNVCVGERMRV